MNNSEYERFTEVLSDLDGPDIERGDRNVYRHFLESEDSYLTLLSRQVHAKSYLSEGFVSETAIEPDGTLSSEIDKSRRDDIEHIVGFMKTEIGLEPCSALRKIPVIPELGLESMPSFEISKPKMTEESIIFLENALKEGRPIREISSFGHSPEVSSAAGFEILRAAYQEARVNGEVWFFSMVSSKHRALQAAFGPRGVRTAGEAVELVDERVNSIKLVPTIVDTTTFFDDVCESIVSETNPVAKLRYQKYLNNFMQGIKGQEVSPFVSMVSKGATPQDYFHEIVGRDTRSKWVEPTMYDLSDHSDLASSASLIKSGDVDDMTSFEGLEYHEGSWFYFPWSKKLTQYPDQDDYRELRTRRNRNLISDEEQEVLFETKPLIAGLSVGSAVLEGLARTGIGDEYVMAEFDKIDAPNLNRLDAGGVNIGESKLDYFAKKVSELDPYIGQHHLHEGITRETLGDLELKPTVLVDAVDDFVAKVLLREFARRERIPLVMASDVGDKAIVDVERHDLGYTPFFHGKIDETSVERILSGDLPDADRMKMLVRIIGLSNASFRLLQSLNDESVEGIPQLRTTVSVGSGLAVRTIRDIILDKHVPSGRRKVDLRKSMGLTAQTGLFDGAAITKDFIKKTTQ